MAFNIDTLDGVNFGENRVYGTYNRFGGDFGHNPAGGVTDVFDATTTASISVAYVTYVRNSLGNITEATQFDPSDANYHAADATTLGTFGSLKMGAITYFVHGFSSSALLLSTDQILTLDQVNGISTAGDANYFEILSNVDLTVGLTSPVNALSPTFYGFPDYNTFAYFVDAAGIKHGVEYYTNADGNTYRNPNYKNVAEHTDHSNDPILNPNPPTYPLIFTQDSSVYALACFAEGVRITTARGEVAVEALEVGDAVVTASGALRPVAWIGWRRIRPALHARPHEAHPVRVRAGAFGDGQPRRDLLLSPGHAIYMQGVLIPAGQLVNGATIAQEEVDTIRYFHIELDVHDVLLAEGLACESYLDDGNRAVFANAEGPLDLHGRLDPVSWDDACAPMVAAGPQLASARAQLIARAEAHGWRLTEEPDLRLSVGGVEIAPLRAEGMRTQFVAPGGQGLRLVSNHAVLSQVAPAFADPRRLGVAVSALRIDGQPVPLDGPALGQGFHPMETHAGAAWRWTNGDAELALDLPQGAVIEIDLLMAAPSWTRPATAPLRLAQLH